MTTPRYALLLLMLLFRWLPGHAQTTYPIQVNVHLLPPYSPYLSDYYSTTRERIAVTFINRDQLKPTVNVKLRMIISAPGSVRIQTNDNAFFQPVAVDNGMPVRLTQDDLAPYFQPNALITQGNLPSGRLPEGMVEFCFQAVEAYTGQVLSASTCARAWIISQKPPLLSLPRNQESVAFREPLNLLFQWTPQHQGLSQVEYDFILKELWDNGMAPQAAFVYAPEIYRETARSTSFAYGAMQPQLLPGKRYAWCVRAKVREGMDELNLFQNEGYSEVRWFTLQDNCMPPQYVEATAERRRLNLKWNALPEHTSFTIAYRPRSQDGVTQQEWKEVQTFEPQTTLYDLEVGKIYEYRVGSLCQGGTPVYTPILTATIPAVDNARLAQCGILPEVNVANQEPLKALQTAEVFYAGDFPITVVTVSGSNGTFTGQGWTEIPWLNDVKVAVEFKNISINTDYRMINGFVEAKYDKQEGQVANVDDVFEGGFDQGLVKTGLTGIDYTLDFSIPGVEAFTLNDAGDLIITDAEGTPHSLPITDKEREGNEGNKVQVFPMTVKDKDGTLYQVEKVTETDNQGNTHAVAKATKLGTAGSPLPPGSFDPDQISERKAIVTFNVGKGRYAFDTWQPYYNKIQLIQDKYRKMGADYYASWKLLPAGGSDQLAATIDVKDNTIDPTKVIFTTPLGTRYNATYDNGTYTLTITAGPAGDVQELYALYPKPDGKYYTFGKVGIATYAPQQHEVVLVTVDNVSIDEDRIRQVLADTYGTVGITWTVRRDAFDYQASGLMAEATGLSTYNDAMRSLNQAYRAARPDFSKSANYLFFLKATGNTDINNRDLTGFMPRGAQFGYIFTSEVQDQYEAVTVAHELGHGRWKLYHPFDKHYGGYDEARLTDNLLAYGNGQHIAKWQWDQIADPALIVSVFEGDEKSESQRVLVPDKFLNKDQKTFSFVTYDGSIISLEKAKLAWVTLNYGTTNFKGTAKQVPGVLQKFALKEGSTTTVFEVDLKQGVYASAEGKVYKESTSISDSDIDGVILGLPWGKKFVMYKFERTGLSRYTGSPVSDPVKDVINFPLRPFGQHKAIMDGTGLIMHTLENVLADCAYCMDHATASMTEPYGQKPEILYVTKIAQYRVSYQVDFEKFTSPRDDWATPKPIIYDHRSIPIGTWGTYLSENPDIEEDFQQGKDTEIFFRIMYERLYATIDMRADNSNDFWANLKLDTPARSVMIETIKLGRAELEALDFEKRKLAIKIIMKQGGVGEYSEKAVISLIGATPEKEQKSMLTFLADTIKFKNIFLEFHNLMGEDNFTRIITLISSFIEDPAPEISAFNKALGPESEIVNIDLDILFNRQTEGYYIDDSNQVHFLSDDGEHDFLVVNYDKRIPVRFWSTFTLVEGKMYKKDEVVADMPAIFVAMLLDVGSTELFSKKAWLVADGVMLFIGAGEVKILFSGASWVRKAIVGSAILGSSMGIVVESLPSSVIDDDLRNRLRIFTVVLSLPEVAKALKDVGKGLIKELRATKAGTNVVEEQRDIENLATALEKGLGEAEIFIDYKKLGVSKLVDLTGFKALDDEFIDIVIHFKNGKFVAQVEKEGAFVEQVVEMTEMAALINRLPAGKSVRLLSCNDLASARELSQQIGNRALYASDGWVDLYADGAVRSQNAFKKLENGEELAEIAVDNTGGVGSKVRLGEELAKGAGEITGTLNDLLANGKFKAIYEPLADGRHISLLKYNVTAAEEAAMKLFVQDDYYRKFNKALAGDIPMTPEYAAMRDLMEAAHAKLPKEVNKLLYRGAGASESIFAKGLKQGDEFDFGGRFTSSSDEFSEADIFRRGGQGDVIWQIESKTAVDITKLNSSEAEFLFKPATKYKLDKIVPWEKDPSILIYKIKEL